MGRLSFAMKQQRWDLAAHTIVLATVRVLNRGEKPNDREKKSRIKG